MKSSPEIQQMGNKIKSALPNIFNFDFPIWDEAYRPVLEEKIIRHYLFDEIGQETVGLWQFMLETKLNEIMPYYNQVYLTTVKDYDYLTDTDITETLGRKDTQDETANFSSNQTDDTDTTQTDEATSTVQGNTQSQTTGNPTSHTAHSDFPQAPLGQSDYASYEDYTQNVLSENNNTDDTQTTDAKTDRTQTTNQVTEYSSKNSIGRQADTSQQTIRKGNSGSRSFTELLIQYRDSLLNIDMMIIDELSDLFMKVW